MNNNNNKSIIKTWVNNKIIDQNQAVVSALSPGFQYGAGLFETIRVDKDKIFYLKEHVARLKRAWEKLFFKPAPEIKWKNIIHTLIHENNLQRKIVAVKLLISKTDTKGGIFSAVFTKVYVHRLEILGKKGLDLITYPDPGQSSLSNYKTLNYLYYDLAGEYARTQKGDEALIVNTDSTISETNTANILAIKDKTIIVPQSLHVLDGVTIKSVLTILSKKGYDICTKKMPKEQFCLY